MNDEQRLSDVGILWKYLALMRGTLFPGIGETEITKSVIAYAQTDYELASFVPDLAALLPVVLRGVQIEKLAEDARRKLGGLAFASMAARVNWIWQHRQEPSEALLISVMCVCLAEDPFTVGVDVSFQHFPAFSLNTKVSSALPIIWALTYDCLLAYPWSMFAEIVFSHTLVSIAANLPPMARLALGQKAVSSTDESFLKNPPLAFDPCLDDLGSYLRTLDLIDRNALDEESRSRVVEEVKSICIYLRRRFA